MKHAFYVRLGAAAFDRRLPNDDVRVLVAVMHVADEQGRCVGHFDGMAASMQFTPGELLRSIGRLERAGYLRAQRPDVVQLLAADTVSA